MFHGVMVCLWEVQWERLHNPNFNPLEFEGVRKQAGANAFTMSPNLCSVNGARGDSSVDAVCKGLTGGRVPYF